MIIKARDVKALRDATGAGMMDAKKALTSANGDIEAAQQLLREQGMAKALARSNRDNDQGAIAVAHNSQCAAVVLLKCETDFSAKNVEFISLVQTLADAVLAGDANSVEQTLQQYGPAIEDLKLKLKENIEVGEVKRVEASAGNQIDVYVHQQSGRGVNAVVVEGADVERDALHQVALHVAFAKPQFLSVNEVPQDEVERERAALLEITKAEGKPERAWDKIVEGRLRGWYGERVLLEQGLHGDKVAVKNSIGTGSIVSFVQVLL